MSITRVARRISVQADPNNFDLELFFEGEPDSTSGKVVDLNHLENILMPWLTPVAEEEPAAFSQRLADKIIRKKPFPGARLIKLRYFLNADHWVDVWP